MAAIPLICAVLGGIAITQCRGTSTQPIPVPAPPPARPCPGPTVFAQHQFDPCRLDNLPLLQSVCKDRAHELDPGVLSRVDYGGQAAAPSFMERQHANLEQGVTPLSLGVLPSVRKGTGVQLPDPISGDDLKPSKRENRDIDMFMPQGQAVKGRDNQFYQGMHNRILQSETKFSDGHGAMDGYMFCQDSPCDPMDAVRNFAGGENMTWRTGGLHPRERIWRQDETLKGRVSYNFRPTNPTYATGKLGSIYQTGTAPLGELELNPNSDVREFHRPPEKNGGAQNGRPMYYSQVDMQHVNRDVGDCDPRLLAAKQCADPKYDPSDVFDCSGPAPAANGSTSRDWAGPAGGSQFQQAARRILNQYVRPKIELPGGIRGFAGPAFGAAQGSYPLEPARGPPLAVREVPGRAPGAIRAFDMTAGDKRAYVVDPRSTFNKETGLYPQEIRSENSTRSNAMQRQPAFYGSESRRVQPSVERDLDCQMTTAIRQNPYAQKLPDRF